MTNWPNGTLHVGVTSDIRHRIFDHKANVTGSFTSKYGLHRMMYVERRENIVDATQCEKNIKHWPRGRKVRLIGHDNPKWNDLAETLPI